MSSTTRTVVGVVFSDQLAAVVDHAAAQDGWRVEPDTRAKRGTNAVVIYPADKDQSPINVSERGAKFNKAHYENLRRQLAHAGLPPLPAESFGNRVIEADSIEDARRQLPDGAKAVNLRELLLHLAGGDDDEFIDSTNDPDILPRIMGTICHGMLVRFGVHDAIALDAGGAVTFALRSAITSHLLANVDIDAVVKAAVAAKEKEVTDALAMASDHEARAEREAAAAARAAGKEAQARSDCRDALEEARTQKERADRLAAALAPLRAALAEEG